MTKNKIVYIRHKTIQIHNDASVLIEPKYFINKDFHTLFTFERRGARFSKNHRDIKCSLIRSFFARKAFKVEDFSPTLTDYCYIFFAISLDNWVTIEKFAKNRNVRVVRSLLN